jgi:hypothetical protein
MMSNKRPGRQPPTLPSHILQQQIAAQNQQIYGSAGVQRILVVGNEFSVSPNSYSDEDSQRNIVSHRGQLELHDHGTDSDHDPTMNQYERIGDRTSGTSTGSSALSHQPPPLLPPVKNASHYADSAIYKRSRGKFLHIIISILLDFSS